MKINNPTENDLAIKIHGTMYECPAGGSVTGITPDNASHWKEIHNFIVVSDDDDMSTDTMTDGEVSPDDLPEPMVADGAPEMTEDGEEKVVDEKKKGGKSKK